MNAKTALACTVGDARGHLLGKIRDVLPTTMEVFDTIVTVAMTSTPDETVRELASAGQVIRQNPDGRIGLHRRLAVAAALQSGADTIFYFDLDHVLRWTERDIGELRRGIAHADGTDLLVIGRSETAMRATPRRLRETEAIVNEVFRLATGHAWDLMMAARGLSREAAALVVEHCSEDSIANDVAWPMLCLHADLRAEYVSANGLTYEINERYGAGENDDLDEDPRQWIKRFRIASEHLRALEDYLPAT